MVLGLAMQTYGEELADQQEVLMLCADILIDVFSAESATLRAQAAADADRAATPRCTWTPRGSSSTTPAMRVEASARQALAAMVEGDTLRTMLAALRRLSKVAPIKPSSCGGEWLTRRWRRGGIFSSEAPHPPPSPQIQGEEDGCGGLNATIG